MTYYTQHKNADGSFVTTVSTHAAPERDPNAGNITITNSNTGEVISVDPVLAQEVARDGREMDKKRDAEMGQDRVAVDELYSWSSEDNRAPMSPEANNQIWLNKRSQEMAAERERIVSQCDQYPEGSPLPFHLQQLVDSWNRRMSELNAMKAESDAKEAEWHAKGRPTYRNEEQRLVQEAKQNAEADRDTKNNSRFTTIVTYDDNGQRFIRAIPKRL